MFGGGRSNLCVWRRLRWDKLTLPKEEFLPKSRALPALQDGIQAARNTWLNAVDSSAVHVSRSFD